MNGMNNSFENALHLAGKENLHPFSRLPTPTDDGPLAKETVKDVQEVSRLIEEHSWLSGKGKFNTTGQTPPVDFKLLSLLAGDSFIHKTALEGYDLKSSLEFFGSFFDRLPKELACKATSELQECRKIAEKLDELRLAGKGKSKEEQGRLVKEYAKKVKEKFEKEGALLMPGGWRSKTGENHAVLYKLEAGKGFTIFNTGSGVENHPMALFAKEKGDEWRSQQFLTKSGVDEKRLHDEDFYCFLIEMYVRGEWDNFDPDSNTFYNGLDFLGGKIGEKDPRKNPEFFKKNQRSGTCAIKSITAALYYSLMDNQKYKPLKFLWQFTALAKFCQTELATLKREDLDLLEDYMANLAASVKKSPLKEWLAERPELFDEFNATFFDIRGRIDHLKKEPAQHLPKLSFAYSEGDCGPVPLEDPDTSVFEKQEASPSELPAYQVPERLSRANEIRTKFKTVSGSNLLETLRELREVKDFVLKDKYIKDNLSNAKYNFRPFSYPAMKGDLAAFRLTLQECVKELVLKNIWSDVPKKDLLNAMEEIHLLMSSLQEVEYQLNYRDEFLSPASISASWTLMYALLLGQETLARQNEDLKLAGYRINYSGLLELAKNPAFILKDPDLLKIYKDTLSAFDPAFNFDTMNVKPQPDPNDFLFSLPRPKSWWSEEEGGHFGMVITNKNLEQPATLRFFKQFTKEDGTPLLDKLAKFFGPGSEIPRELQLLRVDAVFPLICQNLTHNHEEVDGIKMFDDCWGYEHQKGSNPKSYWLNLRISRLSQNFTRKNDDKVINMSTYYSPNGYNQLFSQANFAKNQNEVTPKPELAKEVSLSVETFKELMMLGQDPNDEAMQTLGFIRSHWSLLKNPDIREMVVHHLFRPFRLSDPLALRKELLPKIEQFFQEGLDHFLESNDLEVCLFLAMLGDGVSKHVKEGDFSFLYPFVEKIIPKIKSEPLLLEAHAALAVLGKKPVDLFRFIRLYNQSEKESADLFHKSPLSDPLFLYQKMVEAMGDNLPDGEKICQEILPTATPFKKIGPFCYSNGTYQINLIEGEVRALNALLSKLPLELAKNPVLLTLCKGNLGEIKQINANTYELPLHGIKVHQGKEVQFAKKIDGKWYTLVNNNICQKIPSLQPEFCWMNFEKTEILGMKGDQLLFKMAGKYAGAEFHIEKVTKGDKEWIPFEKVDGSLKWLKDIEGNIECWGAANRVEKIDLIQSGLHFSTRGNGKAYSLEHPGFFLLPEKVAGIGIPHLVLQNSQGEKRVLLSDRKDKWLEYALLDGQLTSQKVENRLFLLEFYLVKKEYQAAKKILLKLNPLDRFSKGERDILARILESLSKNHHPGARVQLMQIASLIEENNLKFPLHVNEVESSLLTYKEVGKPILEALNDTSNLLPYGFTETMEKAALELARATLIEAIKSGETGLSAKLFSMDYQFGKRLAYLTTGKGRLGINKIVFPFMAGGAGNVDKDFGEYFSEHAAKDLHTLLSEARVNLHSFITPSGHSFCQYYVIARHGSEEDKIRLAKVLQFQQINASLAAHLKRCMKNPKEYPDIKVLGTLWKDEKNQAPYTAELAKFHSIQTPFWKILFLLGGLMKNEAVNYLYSLFANTFVRKSEPMVKGATFDKRAQEVKKRDKDEEERLAALTARYFSFVKDGVKAAPPPIPQPKNASDNVIKKIEKENQDLAEAIKDLPVQGAWSLKGDLAALEKELKSDIEKKSLHLKSYKTHLISRANWVPLNDKMKVAGMLSQRNTLDFDELVKQFLTGDFEKTELNAAQKEELFASIADYMMQMTRLKQLNQAMRLIERYKQEKKSVILEGIPKILLVLRHHDIEKQNREFLPFELANGYLYRKEQIDKIEELLGFEDPHILAEMPTGWGKTKTLVPTLNELMAKSGKLLLNIWPASLELTNAIDVQNQMEQSFGKQVDRILFNRQTGFDSKSLQFLVNNMKECQALGKPVNARPETIRALELHFLLALYTLKHESLGAATPELRKKVELLGEILRLFRKEGWAAVDEGHINFDPFDMLIYTLGESKRLPDEQVEVIESLFDILQDYREDFHFELNRQQFLSEKRYQEIAPELAEKIARRLSLDAALIPDFKEFAIGKKTPDWLEEHPDRGRLSLAKGLICHLLKSSLEGAVEETFGLSKLHISSKEYAIPYARSNTPKETAQSPSQYKNPHETFTKTYITYLYRGLEPSQVKTLITTLKQEMETSLADGVPPAECPANKLYQSFFKGKAPNMLLHLTDKEIDELTGDLKKNPKAIFTYIRYVIARQLPLYPLHFKSTAQNFLSQFAKSLTLSATPPDAVSHNKAAKFVPMKGISGKVSYLMLTKGVTWRVVKEELPKEVLQRAQDFSHNVRAIVDTGALFKGLSNREVALALKKGLQQPEIEGFVYFDEKGEKFKVLYKNSDEPQDLEDCEIPPEKLITYYDQSRALGSDIAQAEDAVARILIGKGTTKAAAGQGMGRMRKIHQNQGVEWMVQAPVAEEIKKLYGTDSLKGEEGVGYMIANQAEEEADNNYEALTQQMDNEIRNGMMDQLLSQDVGQALNYFDQFEEHLVGVESTDPYELYAKVSLDRDPRTQVKEGKTVKGCLEEHLDLCLSKLERIKGLKGKEQIKQSLEGYRAKCRDKEIPLPAKVKSPAIESGLDCEVLLDINQQLEMQQQAQIEEGMAIRKPWKFPEELDLFATAFEKTASVNPLPNLFIQGLNMVYRTFNAPYSAIKTRLNSGDFIGWSSLFIGLPFYIIEKITIDPMKWAWKHLSGSLSDQCSIYTVADVIHTRITPKLLGFFSKNLLVSNNFFRVKVHLEETYPETPFSQEQKPLFHVLVIQDKEQLKMMLIDQNDSAYFHRKLRRDFLHTPQDVADKRERKLAIYDLRNGIIVQGKNGFTGLEKNPAFQELLVQARLLNGEVLFNQEELAFIEKNKVEGLGEFLQTHVLVHHTLNRNLYPQTALGKLLGVKKKPPAPAPKKAPRLKFGELGERLVRPGFFDPGAFRPLIHFTWQDQ